MIATSVLHATRDVEESLRHVRDLAAPGGLFVLVEIGEAAAAELEELAAAADAHRRRHSQRQSENE